MPLILLVDDSTTMVMSLSRVLETAGYVVTSASSGRLALEKLAAGSKPGIILTDLNMPEMDGITFIKEVRQMPGGRFVPIIVITTETRAGKRDEARQAGASAWLSKPAAPGELLAALKQLAPHEKA